MFKVFTTSGSVVVTEDHSLLLNNGRCIDPKRLVVFEHELLNIVNPHLLSYNILYQKERWNATYFQSGGKIFFENRHNTSNHTQVLPVMQQVEAYF